jgi:predicted site-specific integrase-resolvase
MNEEFVSIGKAANYLGMSIDGLRKWEADGVLIPERTPTGHRRYRMNDLKTFMHEKPSRQQTTSFVIYARVSTKKQEDAGNLDRQIGRLSAFATEIIVIDQEEKDEQQELVEDLIAITTSFSALIYGKRGGNKLVDVVQTVLQTEGESS